MPYYFHLRHKIRYKSDRLRATRSLKKLRKQLDKEIPQKDAEAALLLATFNIRDFAKGNRRGFGERLPETFFYFAEILSRFDLVAVQEVNRLDEWEEVMDILGPDYDYICSDETDPAIGGNGERLLYLFDKRKVWFKHIAGEIVLPRKMLITDASDAPDDDPLAKGKQFRRTPYVCAFQSSWFKFTICTVHIYFGSSSGSKLKQRIQEIGNLVDYFSDRADEDLKNKNALILLGDFNIVHPEHKTMQALVKKGFMVPKALQKKTNFKQSKYYDQIAFKAGTSVIDFIEGKGADGKPNAGVFNPFVSVMTDKQSAEYADAAKASKNGKGLTGQKLKDYYEEWKTYQVSDHFPLWARINVNASSDYLDDLEEEFERELE